MGERLLEEIDRISRYRPDWLEVALIALMGIGFYITVTSLKIGEHDAAYRPSIGGALFGSFLLIVGILVYGNLKLGTYDPFEWQRILGLRRWKNVAVLSPEVWYELHQWRLQMPWNRQIGRDNDIYLASAVTKDGRVFPCTMFVEAGTPDQERLFPSKPFFGVLYKFDSATMVEGDSVKSVSRSPYAPTVEIKEKLGLHGGPGDPIIYAKLIMKDGAEIWVRAGYRDFVGLPQGRTAVDIIRVEFPYDDPSLESARDKLAPHVRTVLCLFRRPNN